MQEVGRKWLGSHLQTPQAPQRSHAFQYVVAGGIARPSRRQALENHKVHRQDENSSNGSTVIQPVSSRQSDIQETSSEIQEETEDENGLYQSFDKTIDE